MKYLNFLLGLALMMVSISAVAAPSYQMPFACNETWRLATFDYHNPLRAVDMNRDGDFGDSVVASAAGTVSVRRDLGDTSYGRYLVIDHGNDYNTLYAHLSAFDVSIGQSVRKGQRIGYVGSTGTSSPHLHYEQRIGGTAKPVVFNGVAVPYYTA
ncbi:MAG: M23 family metallopeptidase, partial [Arenimonas sp.]